MGETREPTLAEREWEARYRSRDAVWSGRANPLLVAAAEGLAPGTALDLGCGEGGDALWLARRGWRVTAVDVSPTALGRGADAARDAGLADAIDWQAHDLAETFPDGAFDLVAASYLHSWIELPRTEILRRAAAAVAPGGALVVVGHEGEPPSGHEHGGGRHGALPTAPEVHASLGDAVAGWTVVRCESAHRAPGMPGPPRDNVLHLRRPG